MTISPVSGQIINATNPDGSVIRMARHTNVSGNPYFFEDWRMGDVTYVDGSSVRDLFLKYDQISDEVIFLVNEQEYTFDKPVKNFFLRESGGNVVEFRSGFTTVGNGNERAFYQVLYEGEHTHLLKKSVKSVVERKEYGSASINLIVQEKMSYYLSTNGQDWKEVKRDKKSVLSALDTSKIQDLEQFIKSDRLNMKSEDDIVKLLDYYETFDSR